VYTLFFTSLRSLDIRLANRMSKDLNDVKNKVYTRDLFNSN